MLQSGYPYSEAAHQAKRSTATNKEYDKIELIKLITIVNNLKYNIA